MLSSESFAMSQWLFRSNAMMTKLQALVLHSRTITTTTAGSTFKESKCKMGNQGEDKSYQKNEYHEICWVLALMKLVIFLLSHLYSVGDFTLLKNADNEWLEV